MYWLVCPGDSLLTVTWGEDHYFEYAYSSGRAEEWYAQSSNVETDVAEPVNHPPARE